jgi:site-specific DNA-methyltransferase (adenine-specific)
MLNYNIVCADCVEQMQKLEPGSVDVVVTSPPYNLGIKYRKYKDTAKRKIYLEWTHEWVAEVKRVLRKDGSFFLNLGGCPKQPMLPFQMVSLVCEYFTLQNTFHWIKSVTIHKKGEEISVGHFKPINSKRFVNDCHEYVLHFTKTGKVPIDRLALGVKYADKSNIKRWKGTQGKDRRCRGNLWYIPYKTIQSRAKDRPHPATFPPALAENCFRLHGVDPQTVALDPFVGLGNSAVGALNCGIESFLGYDIDDYYIAETINSIKSHDRNQTSCSAGPGHSESLSERQSTCVLPLPRSREGSGRDEQDGVAAAVSADALGRTE